MPTDIEPIADDLGRPETPEEKQRRIAAMAQANAEGRDPYKDPAANPVGVNGLQGQSPEQIAAARQKAEAEFEKAKYESMFQYGGSLDGADLAANRYAEYGLMGQQRPGERIDYTGALGHRTNALQTREQQLGMAGLMASRARGQVPSIAQMQADRQMQQAAAEQSSAAASARGPAGLALAQQGAAANTAAMQSNISGQAQINAAAERLAAEQAAYGAYSGVRGGDMQGQGLDAQQAQAQAAINAAQRAQNDQYQLGMTGYETDVRKAQLGASGNRVAIESGQATAMRGIDASKSMHSDNRVDKYVGYGLGALGTGLAIGFGTGLFGGGGHGPAPGGVAPSGSGGTYGTNQGAGYQPGTPGTGADPTGHYDPYKADGGPVQADRPYIVGERGPELMVPARSGLVVPAEETRGLLAGEAALPSGASQAGAGLVMPAVDPRKAAWDEGHAAALEDIKRLSKKTPDELRAYGDDPRARAVRDLKGDAWDEGRGGLMAAAPKPSEPATARMATPELGLLRMPTIGEQYLAHARGLGR